MKENKSMNNNFDRLLSLAKKTKSTLVVYDPEGQNNCVILGVEQYEKLVLADSAPVESQKVEVENLKVIEQKKSSEPVSAPIVADDLAADEAVLEALNQRIAEWRASQPVAESVVETQSEPEPPAVPTQPASVPQSSSWHRLGDVMATSLKPKMPEVRYEEIGELEAPLPVTHTDETANFSEPEPLDDEPLFLEEPVN